MKKKLIILMTLVLLIGCSKSSDGVLNINEGDNDLILNRDNYPSIDGSTANIPLAEHLARHFLDLSDGEISLLTDFSTTDIAYINLAEQRCDLVLAYEIAPETLQQLGDSADFDYYEIGLDALVFLVNSTNTVTTLSPQQIIDIYSAKISNWKDVGGEDMEIKAFQRSSQSGSQTLMEKLVMKETELMPRPEMTIATMSGLINVIEDYVNFSDALGYSVYYYVTNMYQSEGVSLLAVDGVYPTPDTIALKTYPFINPFYAVVRHQEAKDSPARLLALWLTTTSGKLLLEEAGYVAIK